MKPYLQRNGNICIRHRSGIAAAIVTRAGKVIWYDRTSTRSIIELHARKYLTRPSLWLDWANYPAPEPQTNNGLW